MLINKYNKFGVIFVTKIIPTDISKKQIEKIIKHEISDYPIVVNDENIEIPYWI